ncbi:MAG: HAD family hydrolase [Eubacteriales bacterium]|nr:HAD family hydrolase [Eubacteriales bacterium]
MKNALQKPLAQLERPLALVACDLDGTLLNENSEVSPENQKVLIDCLDQGIKVLLVTGRPYRFAKTLRDSLDPRIGIISYVGAYLDLDSESENRAYPMSKAQIEQMLEISENFDLECYLKSIDTVYAYNAPSGIGLYPKEIMQNVELKDPHLALNQEILKTIYFGRDYSQVLELRKALESCPEFTITDGGFGGCEVVRHDRNKGVALSEALAYFGIPRAASIAFGDSHNDLDLLAASGLGVAMGNATAELKAAADYVCLKNSEDGVAEVIKSILAEA